MRPHLWPAAGTVILVVALQGCLGAPPSGGRLGAALQGDGFSWLPFGPAAPNSWYRSLEDGDCANVRNDANDILVQASAAVCRAAIGKQRSEWDVAQRLTGQGLKGSGAAACLDAAAIAMIQRALAWHAAHPDADPVVTLRAAGEPVACTFKVTKVSPAQGPLAGGTQIEITGEGLNEVTGVSIGAATVKVDSSKSEDQNGVTVDVLKATTPAAMNAGAVTVAVRNRAGIAVAPAAFTYLPSPVPIPTPPSRSDNPRPPSPDRDVGPPTAPAPSPPRTDPGGVEPS